jgi:hypothetical protein
MGAMAEQTVIDIRRSVVLADTIDPVVVAAAMNPAMSSWVALRAARLQIVGSGQGSVSAREYLAELPALAEQIAAGRFDVDARAMPLSDVEQAWAAAADARKRIVLIPQQ